MLVDRTGFGPGDCSKFSNRKAWWRCERAHEWEAQICNVARGGWCRRCWQLTDEGPLSTTHPDLASTLLAARSGFSADDVPARSTKRAWWRCERGHETAAPVCERALRGKRCVHCKGLRNGSLREHAPELAAQLDEGRSGFSADDIGRYSNRNAWWTCPDCAESFPEVVANRARGSGCPGCDPRGWTWKRLRAALRSDEAVWREAVAAGDAREYFERLGVLASLGTGRSVVEGLLDGDISASELSAFMAGEESELIRTLIAEHDPSQFGAARPYIPIAVRRRVYARDGFCCLACDATEPLSIDHKVPRTLGGLDEEPNYQTLCRSCNSLKSNMLMSLDELRARAHALRASRRTP